LLRLQGVLSNGAYEQKVKDLIKKTLAEFPDDLLLFLQFYSDMTPGVDAYQDKVQSADHVMCFIISKVLMSFYAVCVTQWQQGAWLQSCQHATP
jgi:hypothetical protein